MSSVVNYDNIVVLNTESTCWEDGTKPKHEEQEIIEIGVCLLNVKTLQVHSDKRLIIKPEKSTISEYCFDLTGLSNDIVSKGISLGDACEILKNIYKTKNRVWASYGEYDKKMFNYYCKENKIEYPFNNRFINVKSMFPIVFGIGKELSLSSAMKTSDIFEEELGHCAGENVINVANILCEIIRGGSANGNKKTQFQKSIRRTK